MSKRDDDLNRFVREALSKGIARAEVRQALLRAGWAGEQVEAALGAYSEVTFAVPVPTPRQYISAQEAFFYLVLFTTLYLAVYALGKLSFNFIEQAFPDALYRAGDTERSIRWSLALLVVTLPVFLFTTHHVNRLLTRDPTKAGSPTRKWLTYIALFIAVTFLIGDFVTLVFGLLGGELTARFLLKVATVALLAGAVFGYYLHDLKRDERVP
ncbi:MAG: DUF5671 domain-containing protein [Kiloniellaceae bacterium]